MTQATVSCPSFCHAPPYYTLRVDSVSGNIYKYSAANGCSYSPFEVLFDSLSARQNDTVRNNCGVSQWRYRCIDTLNQTIFGTSRKTKFFNETQFESGYGRRFVQGIGIFLAASPGLFCSQNQSTLVGCVLDGVLYGDTSMLVGINQINSEIPENFSLSQNYPNPFNPMTNIKFQIPKLGFVKITVFDVLGKEVQILVNQQLSPGTYEADFDGSNLTSGVYYYQLTIINEQLSILFNETKKMVLVK